VADLFRLAPIFSGLSATYFASCVQPRSPCSAQAPCALLRPLSAARRDEERPDSVSTNCASNKGRGKLFDIKKGKDPHFRAEGARQGSAKESAIAEEEAPFEPKIASYEMRSTSDALQHFAKIRTR
jgi:hypothetical protein